MPPAQRVARQAQLNWLPGAAEDDCRGMTDRLAIQAGRAGYRLATHHLHGDIAGLGNAECRLPDRCSGRRARARHRHAVCGSGRLALVAASGFTGLACAAGLVKML